MVRVRLEGLPEEVHCIADAMQAAGCDLGFVPIAEARWRLTRYGGNSAWYYCRPWDVRYDPDRAKELLETGPREYDRLPDGRPYDGRPWWQA